MAEAVAVCGLAAEARIARMAGFSAVSGAADAARTTVLIESKVRGADCLVSFGIAGGLAPKLQSGTVILSGTVIEADRRWDTGDPLAGRIGEWAIAIGATEGAVFGAAGLLVTPADKARARAQTGAVAVDLESAAVARIATAAGVPFIVLRAVADPAECGLPSAACLPLAGAGRPDLGAILRDAMRHPRQIPRLVRLAGETRTALAALVVPARALRRLLAGR